MRIKCVQCNELIDGKEYRQHLKDEHHITESPKVVIDPKTEPISRKYVKLHRERGGTRLFFNSLNYETDKEELIEISYPPDAFNIITHKNDEPEFKGGILSGPYNGYLMNLHLEASFIPFSQFKLYSIPIGFHHYCSGCPKSFDKKISDIGADRKTNTELSRIPGLELDVLKFRCMLDLCSGIKKKYKDKLLIYEKQFQNEELIEVIIPYDTQKNTQKNAKKKRRTKARKGTAKR